MVPKIMMEATMVRAITSTDHTLDSYPTAMPDRMVVAGPVLVALRISCTGALWVPVKYSVRRSMAMAKSTPTVVARKGRHHPPITSCM